MTDTNTDSFLDEVAEAVRRDRLARWFRRWGWLIALVVAGIIGTAAVLEWRKEQAEADAQLRGEAILTALETEDPAARLAALEELPVSGDRGATAALLLAAEQADAGDTAAAIGTLSTVAGDSQVPPLTRDLATLKSLLLQGTDADPAALEALAAPGAPFGLLAREQLALIALEKGETDDAIARLQAIREDAEVTPSQRGRVEALLNALGVPPEAAEAPVPDVPAPAGE